jgi:hypothetical protein
MLKGRMAIEVLGWAKGGRAKKKRIWTSAHGTLFKKK